ncbi:MAG: hypothetical protein KJ661_04995 [Candidatus Omnitrophica bacterium]|nr:hypothetical protein [Candidatus Omnitrophota bacterium]
MKEQFQTIENHWLWIWLKNNAIQLTIIGAVCVWISATFLLPLFQNIYDKAVHANTRPNIKITSVTYKGQIYQESPTSQSEALNFFIAIRNEGDASAYDVQVKKKILKLPRGTFGLRTPSLQTPITNTKFDIPERKVAMDSIFIDENPTNMQDVRNGKKSIALEYEIIYYGDKNKRIGPFVYKYQNSTTDGIFEESTAKERIDREE